MYITKVNIKNIRSIEDLTIDFGSKSKSIILSGDNGSGKSTILRSIAMGISDQDSAASVLRELPGELIRKGEKSGQISLDLIQGNGKKYRIITNIKSLKAFEKIEQITYKFENGKSKQVTQDEFPWHTIFTTGYGAGVRNLGTADYQHYVPIDALYSLFKYDVPLQNPELSMRRVIAKAKEKGKKNKRGELYAKKMEDYLTKLLKNVLNLDKKDKVVLTSTSIVIKSSKWGTHELNTLGDGYISTVTWVLDLISWWMLYLKLGYKNIHTNRDIKGIVLIDEIEQHLHPIWQVKIMELLRNSFPKIQFITSTHSPLVISSQIEVPVYVLDKSESEIINVSGWLAEDVYRDVMGLETSRSGKIKNMIDLYKNLHLKKLRGKTTRKEESKIISLKKILLKQLPGYDPIVESAELKNITKILK